MTTFEVTFKNGQKTTYKAGSFNDFALSPLIFSQIAKIEAVDKRKTMQDVKKVNEEFRDFARTYRSLEAIANYVIDTLLVNGFDEIELSDLEGTEGAIRCKPIGRETYLCVTWYQMPSGLYEFVGYVS